MAASAPTDYDAGAAQPPEAGRTVLVVDDDARVRLLLDMMLRQESFEVISAEDGEQALAAARAHHPNVILLDIEMPRMHGYDVCRELKADPRTQDIPVIMVTAKGQQEERVRGLAVGADDFVTKPFSPRDLLQRLRALLNRTPNV